VCADTGGGGPARPYPLLGYYTYYRIGFHVNGAQGCARKEATCSTTIHRRGWHKESE
jgi:hypothetical protein